MKTLPPELFEKYKFNPYTYDEEVRKFAEVPDDRYYTVSMWPEERAGVVNVYVSRDKDGHVVKRVVHTKKISKSS